MASLLLVLLHLGLATIIRGHFTTHDPSIKPPWNFTWEDKLKKHLFTHYDKHSRPTNGSSSTTVVKLGILVAHVNFDELRSIMAVNALIRMSWMDQKFKWNSSEFGGLENLHVGAYEIWRPDVVLYNSATGSMIDHYASTHCLVSSDGLVHCVPPALMIVFCTLNLRFWPFDSQTCHLQLGSWTYNGEQLDLQPGFGGVEMALFVNSSEWEVQSITDKRNERYYSCCTEPFIDITFNVTVRRRSPAYSAIVITPTTVIVLLTLAVFLLPPHAGEKLIICSCTAIIICIFLLYFSQKLSALAGHTPLVLMFYTASLHLVAISAILSVVVLNLSQNAHASRLPLMVKNVINGRLRYILRLGCVALETPLLRHREVCVPLQDSLDHQSDDHCGISNEDSHMITNSPSLSSIQQDWLMLATAIDRMALLFFCFLFVILAIAFSI